jgi:hypothetical protein
VIKDKRILPEESNPWSDVRAETYPITKEIKPGVDDV